MNRALLLSVIAAIAICCPGIASAKGAKTVHVRSYTRKDGTVVRAHMRSPPGSGSSSGSSSSSYSGFAPITPRTSYRTSARSSARTSYQLGALSGEADDDSLTGSSDQPAATPSPDPLPVSPPKLKPLDLPTRYIAHLTSGKTKALTDFSEEDGKWALFPVTGGRIGYAKSMVAYFEPTAEALDVVRMWTDVAGTHHATAKFSHIDGENVMLTKDDGKTIHIPIDRLSETDRDLAKRFQELKSTP